MEGLAGGLVEGSEGGDGGVEREGEVGTISMEYYRERSVLIGEQLEELKAYVLNDFNKHNKEKRIEYFSKRFGLIIKYKGDMVTEFEKVAKMGEKVASIEQSCRRALERDAKELTEVVKAQLEVVGERIIEGVKRECLGMMDTLRIGGLDGKSLAGGLEDVKKSITKVSEVVGRLGDREPLEVAEETEGTWAQVLKRGRAKRKGPQVVLEVEKDKVVKRGELQECLNPKEGEFRIRGLRKQGRNFVVEVHDKEDVEN